MGFRFLWSSELLVAGRRFGALVSGDAILNAVTISCEWQVDEC
jgi:hypothetical protein